MALRPHVHRMVDQTNDLSEPAGGATPDALGKLPSSYASAPVLGPPLPGDLGKPVLEQQQASLLSSQPAVAPPVDTRRADESRAESRSGLLVPMATETRTSASSDPASLAPAPQAGAAQPAAIPDRDLGDQQRKVEFVRATDQGPAANSHEMFAPPSPYLLSAGSVIAASLITGLRSDLPGLVTAQVTENVYDSAGGEILLIPQGARLVGSYDNVVAFAQRRALLVWQRIIWPDGSSLVLDNVPGTDAAGHSGLEDQVDFHGWQLLKGVAISTLLGVGAELQFAGGGGLTEAVRQSTQQNVSRAGDQLTSKALDIPPTITIRPGAPVRLVVQRDLVMRPWMER
ncbi:MAG: TrbI/VirB10 family protein, partial [Sphingomonas oligoaromativorans]